MASTYAYEHDYHLPPADNWEVELRSCFSGNDEEFSKLMVSPFPPAPRRFAMNKSLSNLDIRSVAGPGGPILFFESVSSGPSAADYLTSLPAPDDDSEIVVLRLDGQPHFFRGANIPSWPPGGEPVSGLTEAIQESHRLEKVLAARK